MSARKRPSKRTRERARKRSQVPVSSILSPVEMIQERATFHVYRNVMKGVYEGANSVIEPSGAHYLIEDLSRRMQPYTELRWNIADRVRGTHSSRRWSSAISN